MRKGKTRHINHLEICLLVQKNEHLKPSHFCNHPQCVDIFLFELEEAVFYAGGGKRRTGGQVQGTALCLRGYPCWGCVFKIYCPHS